MEESPYRDSGRELDSIIDFELDPEEAATKMILLEKRRSDGEKEASNPENLPERLQSIIFNNRLKILEILRTVEGKQMLGSLRDDDFKEGENAPVDVDFSQFVIDVLGQYQDARSGKFYFSEEELALASAHLRKLLVSGEIYSKQYADLANIKTVKPEEVKEKVVKLIKNDPALAIVLKGMMSISQWPEFTEEVALEKNLSVLIASAAIVLDALGIAANFNDSLHFRGYDSSPVFAIYALFLSVFVMMSERNISKAKKMMDKTEEAEKLVPVLNRIKHLLDLRKAILNLLEQNQSGIKDEKNLGSRVMFSVEMEEISGRLKKTEEELKICMVLLENMMRGEDLNLLISNFDTQTDKVLNIRVVSEGMNKNGMTQVTQNALRLIETQLINRGIERSLKSPGETVVKVMEEVATGTTTFTVGMMEDLGVIRVANSIADNVKKRLGLSETEKNSSVELQRGQRVVVPSVKEVSEPIRISSEVENSSVDLNYDLAEEEAEKTLQVEENLRNRN